MRTMRFDVKCVKDCLIKHGMVYTVRSYSAAKTTTVDVTGVGKCVRQRMRRVNSKEDIKALVPLSGFDTVEEWWKAVERFGAQNGWLYFVRVIDPDTLSFKTISGDLWTVPATHRVITTNGVLKRNGAAVMGKGSALQARTRYPGIDFELGKLIRKYGNHVFMLSHGLASFPTKHHWKEASDLKLIERSARELLDLFRDEHDAVVAMPPPGCGNGGLTWEVVQPILIRYLDERFTVILNH